MRNYFGGHRERPNYARRLRRGQSLGSGLVAGPIKPLLDKRLKPAGARWEVEHVGPFVELGALAAGPEWQAFWENLNQVNVHPFDGNVEVCILNVGGQKGIDNYMIGGMRIHYLAKPTDRGRSVELLAITR